MRTWQRVVVAPALAGALLLAGCGSGVEVESSAAPSAAGGLTEADVEATVQARLAEAQASAEAAASVAASPSAAASLEASEAASPSAEASESASPSAEASESASPSAEASEAASPSAEASQAPSAEASVEASAAASAAASAEPAASQAPAASGEGFAIAVARNGTVNILSGGTWTQPGVEIDDEECSSSTARAFFDDRGSAFFNCNYDQFESADGAAWAETEIEDLREITFYIVGLDGRVYGSGSESFLRLAGGTVEQIGTPQDFGGERVPTLSKGAFNAEGRGLVVGSVDGEETLFEYDGSAWKTVGKVAELTGENNFSVSSIIATSKGEFLLSGYSELRRLENGQLVPELNKEQFGAAYGGNEFNSTIVEDMVETPDGRIWMATDEGLFVWDGANLGVQDRTTGLPAKRILDLDVDDAGNVWAATQFGLAVQRGDTWEVAVPSTSDLTDSRIFAIGVKGAPALPAAAAEPETTTVTGRVSEDGQAVADAQIELCSEVPGGYNRRNVGDTPCANQFYTQAGTTDASGNYRFENVPTGTYTAAYFSPKENDWVFFVNLDVVALEPGGEVIQDIATD